MMISATFRSLHRSRRSGRTPTLVVGLALLLVSIRLVAGYICVTCPNTEYAELNARTYHLHSEGGQEPCAHGKAVAPNPLTLWACAVTQDEWAFVLPEIPRLPVVVSVFEPLILLVAAYQGRSLVAAHGRGPPFSTLPQ